MSKRLCRLADTGPRFSSRFGLKGYRGVYLHCRAITRQDRSHLECVVQEGETSEAHRSLAPRARVSAESILGRLWQPKDPCAVGVQGCRKGVGQKGGSRRREWGESGSQLGHGSLMFIEQKNSATHMNEAARLSG